MYGCHSSTQEVEGKDHKLQASLSYTQDCIPNKGGREGERESREGERKRREGEREGKGRRKGGEGKEKGRGRKGRELRREGEEEKRRGIMGRSKSRGEKKQRV